MPVFDPGLWGPFEDAVGASAWALEAGQTSTGGTVRWLLDKLGGGLPINAERYPAADAAAAATPAGAEGLMLLDFWQGSRTPLRDPLARGTIWGLTPRHEIGHLLRAVYVRNRLWQPPYSGKAGDAWGANTPDHRQWWRDTEHPLDADSCRCRGPAHHPHRNR